MRTSMIIALMASALAAPAVAGRDDPARGVEAVNVPVVTRADFAFDAAAPDGSLPASERARLDAWFAALGLGYGDRVYVSGPYAEAALRTGDLPESVFGGLEAHLDEWGLGSVSETADGDPPHAGTGCPFQAWSVAEFLRARRLTS